MRKFLDTAHDFIVSGMSGDLGDTLAQAFFVLVAVLLFFSLNVVVRFFTDSITLKVMRIREDSPLPSIIALVATAVLFAYALVAANRHIPSLRPTVLGWAGKKIERTFIAPPPPGKPAPKKSSPK